PSLASYGGPPRALLPWDSLRIRIAEPVDADALRAAAQLRAGATPIDAKWTIEGGTANADWAGAIQLKGQLVRWDGPLQQSPLLVLEPLADRVGNMALGREIAVSFAPLLANQPAHNFDGDVVTVAYWGDAQLTFLGGFAGDPHCEHGGCVKMGSFPA